MLFFPWFFISIFIYLFKLNIFKEKFYFTIISRSTILTFHKNNYCESTYKGDKTTLLHFKVISDNYFFYYLFNFIQFLKVTFHLHITNLLPVFLVVYITPLSLSYMLCTPSPPLWFLIDSLKRTLANSTVFKLDSFKQCYI